MSDNPYRELRRYMMAGNTEKAHKLLTALVEKDPQDFLARDELARFEKGEPMLSEKPASEYRMVVRDALSTRLSLYTETAPAASFGHLSNKKLQALRAELERLVGLLEANGGSCTPAVRDYMRRLRRTMFKRWFRTHRKLTLLLLGLAAMVPVAGGAYFYLKQQARTVGEALDQAVQAGLWQNVHTLRETAGSGIHRLLNPSLSTSIYKADAWVIQKQQAYRNAGRHMEPLRRGIRKVESLSLGERAMLERELAALPAGLDDLSPLWRELCQKEQEQLERRKKEELSRVNAPLPDWPVWTQDPQADGQSLGDMLKETEYRLRDFQDAILVYHLPQDNADHVEARLKEIRQRIADLEVVQKALEDIAKAGSAKEYHQALPKDGLCTWYAHARTLDEARQRVPKPQSFRYHMVDKDGLLPQDFVEEALHTFLETGPTFTAKNPANARQVALMEELFTSRTLRTRLFEIREVHGGVAYSDKEPEIIQNGFVSITRDELDPEYHLGKNAVYWRLRDIKRRTVDPTPLVEAAGLDRRTFYVKANLPQILGAMVTTEAKDCPALVRAYIFDRLLQVLAAHDSRDKLGLRFSPTLEADYRSFIDLRNSTGIELEHGCWMTPTDSKQRAEEEFRRWFSERRNRDYAREIARNFGKTANVHAAYAGYVSPDGKLHTHRTLPHKAELWYVGKDGAIRHAGQPDGGVLVDALPYSPLYIEEKENN